MSDLGKQPVPLTVELGRGSDVTIADLSCASAVVSELLDAVGREMTHQPRPFDWVVSVRSGSVITEMRPTLRADVDPSLGEEVADVVARGIAAVQADQPLPPGFAPAAAKAAARFRDVIDHGTSLVVVTPKRRVTVTDAVSSYRMPATPTRDYLGSVTGRLEAVNIHGNPRFTVWDEWGRRVECSIRPSLSVEEVAAAVGQRVVVYGIVKPRDDGHVSVVAQRVQVLAGDASVADELPAIFRDAELTDW